MKKICAYRYCDNPVPNGSPINRIYCDEGCYIEERNIQNRQKRTGEKPLPHDPDKAFAAAMNGSRRFTDDPNAITADLTGKQPSLPPTEVASDVERF